MQTPVQNSFVGSGAGSEQQREMRRDLGGESSESLTGHSAEIGSDKVRFGTIYFPLAASGLSLCFSLY